MIKIMRTSVFAVMLLALVACNMVTKYDPISYKTSTDLKAEALATMTKAVEPANLHFAEIEGLELELRKAYEYESGKSANFFTTEQWSILIAKDGNLLGGFLALWKSKDNGNGGMSQAFVDNAKELVSDAFDEIIRLENNKRQ